MISLPRFCFPVLAVVFCVAGLPLSGVAQPPQTKSRPVPDIADYSYGPHERQVFDLWQASGTGARPLVLYIHGGGYTAGDKSSLRTDQLTALLNAGVSVAAVNYRYYQQAPLPAALHDARRALQTLRTHAAEWNLDPSRVGAFGGSAGAVTCMYLAFHDDMADPQSPDPVERQSTRLTCVATTGGQTTLDTSWWHANIPGFQADNADSHSNRRWGISEADYPAQIVDLSARNQISADDPPIWMSYNMRPEDPVPEDASQALNFRVHHVNFGIALKKQMDELEVGNVLVYPGQSDARYKRLTDFLIDRLTAEQ